MNAENKTLTVGEEFKKQFGYSRTMKRLMDKHNCKTPEEYKAIRKERQKEVRKDQKRKRDKAQVYMRTSGKKRTSKHKKRTKGWSLGGSKLAKGVPTENKTNKK